MNEPMIWTKYGNLPEESLKREVLWEVTDDYAKCVVRYLKDGEVVKEGADVFLRKGVMVTPEVMGF